MESNVTNEGPRDLTEPVPVFRCFQTISNELEDISDRLMAPKLLHCPADMERSYATNFTSDFGNERISYFIGADAQSVSPRTFLSGDRNITNGVSTKTSFLLLPTNSSVGWTEAIHKKQGNILLSDGSVQGLSKVGLQQALTDTEVAITRLLMP
jgi:hypothetical protein